VKKKNALSLALTMGNAMMEFVFASQDGLDHFARRKHALKIATATENVSTENVFVTTTTLDQIARIENVKMIVLSKVLVIRILNAFVT
jgi:hypothetical protein